MLVAPSVRPAAPLQPAPRTCSSRCISTADSSSTPSLRATRLVTLRARAANLSVLWLSPRQPCAGERQGMTAVRELPPSASRSSSVSLESR